MSRSLDDPCAGELWEPGDRPLIDRSGKGFLRNLLSKIEVANEPDEGGDDAAPVGSVNLVYGDAYVKEHHNTIKTFSRGVDCDSRHSIQEWRHTMRYMLLIYADEKNSITQEEREDCYVKSAQLAREIQASGNYLAASPLHLTSTATSVQVRDNKRLVTDGPFAETREQLGGYYLINAENLDEAITIASRIPAAKWGTVEVRPVMEIPGLPD